jgi:hypothetical protein
MASGKPNPDNAAPPFATRDGKPIDPPINTDKPTNFLKSNGRSVNADPSAPRDPSLYAPTKLEDDESRASPGALGNRPQQVQKNATAADTKPAETPQGNRFIQDSARVKQAGTGSSGNASRPFKNMK